MKRPVLFIPLLFVAILVSSAMIAMTVSGIFSSLQIDNEGKNIQPTAKSADKHNETFVINQ